MKKYSMLIITIIMIFLTSLVYAYDSHNSYIPKIKQPDISIASSKFGEIKNIVWLDNYIIGDDASLIILSSKSKNGINYSSLYYLNVGNGKYKLLCEFPAHKYLDDVILFDNAYSSNCIVTASDKGIYKTYITLNDNKTDIFPRTDFIKVDGFENATSMELKGNLIYTKENDKLIYIKQIMNTISFMMITNSNAVPGITKYYKKPCNIINCSTLDDVITYTSASGNTINLYAMKGDGTPLLNLNKPLIKNLLYAREIEQGHGLVALNTEKINKKNNSLNVLMYRRLYVDYNEPHLFDSIPNNTDMNGAIPSADADTYNQDFTIAYTAYDKDHKGSIKVCNYKERPKVIIKDENIFGPVRISQKKIDGDEKRVILYFTRENNKVRIKLSDINGKLIKDITNIVI
jgi:hypothetical protein